MAQDRSIYKIEDGTYHIFGNTWGNGQFGLIYSDDETKVRIKSTQNITNPIYWETITEIEDNVGGFYADKADLEERGLPGFTGMCGTCGGVSSVNTQVGDVVVSLNKTFTPQYYNQTVVVQTDTATGVDPFGPGYNANQSLIMSLIVEKNLIQYSLSARVSLGLWVQNTAVRFPRTSEFQSLTGDVNVEWWYEDNEVHFYCDTDGVGTTVVSASLVLEEDVIQVV